MNSLPVALGDRAIADLKLLQKRLRPAVQEHLARLGANYKTCSRPTAFPHPPGRLETGFWCRHAVGASLVEIIFQIEVEPAQLVVRRVLTTGLTRLPDWSLHPTEWGEHSPWPILDV